MEGASQGCICAPPNLYAALVFVAAVEAGVPMAPAAIRRGVGRWAALLIGALLLGSFLYSPVSGLSSLRSFPEWMWSIFAFGLAWRGLVLFAGTLRFERALIRIGGGVAASMLTLATAWSLPGWIDAVS